MLIRAVVVLVCFLAVQCLLGKVVSWKGDFGIATPFTDVTVDQISNLLHIYGYQKRGWEPMYNGWTGRKLEAHIFLGPTFYQRLKHMVDDKVCDGRWCGLRLCSGSKLLARLLNVCVACRSLLYARFTLVPAARCRVWCASHRRDDRATVDCDLERWSAVRSTWHMSECS